ncbi:MAG: hypothetical protein MUP45_03985 [Candidatus Marinimicrobia bacterium]|nr:hypothetical protein [Candidatus Neomarinimicrobiota bacterium]
MPENNSDSNDTSKQDVIHFIIKDSPAIFLSLTLFLGGIWLLSLRIPGWSLLFGLIATPLGLVFTIYTLDDVSRNVVTPPPFKATKCHVCGKITYAKEEDKDVICWRCRGDITEEILKERLKG